MGFFSKLKNSLKKTKSNVISQVESMLKSFSKIDDELFAQLEESLIMGDVGVATAQKICCVLRDRVRKDGVKDPSLIYGLLEKIIAEILSGESKLNLTTKPSIILIVGVNGVGKTTTIGKLADKLKKDGKKVILAAADTFRAAAIDQLEVWAKRSGSDIVKHNEGSDPAAVVFDTISAAKARNCDVILCDTAGRLHNKKHLMDELFKINKIISRELQNADKEILLVLDATTGQNAVNQAKEFKNVTNLTGVVLTKLDGTAKGGIVISIKEELGIPVKLMGVGEQIDDLQTFDANSFAKALFEKDSND